MLERPIKQDRSLQAPVLPGAIILASLADSSALPEIRSALQGFAWVLGGVLGVLLILTVHFARAAHLRSGELRRARDELELRVEERTVELQHTNEHLQAEIAKRQQTEDSLQDLSGRLLRLQDEERRRIARELHDSTAQMLSAIAINVDRAQGLAQNGEYETLGHVLGESADLVKSVTLEIRTLSYLLHPPTLDALGLEYVLPSYVEGFSNRSGISVSLNIQPDLGRLPPEIELTLFRIAQEGLSNVHRHSGSRMAGLTLLKDSGSAVLEIRDQGCGIPPGVLEQTTETSGQIGLGIAGMRERVRQLGGHIAITSGDGGTAIRTVLPLAAPPATTPPVSGAAGNADAGSAVRGTTPDVGQRT